MNRYSIHFMFKVMLRMVWCVRAVEGRHFHGYVYFASSMLEWYDVLDKQGGGLLWIIYIQVIMFLISA